MKKIYILILISSSLFSGEIFSEKSISHICKTKGYLNKFGDENSCKKYFKKNNEEVLRAKSIEKLSINEIIKKRFSKVKEKDIPDYSFISRNLSLNTKTELYLIDDIFRIHINKPYPKTNYFNYSNNPNIFRGPNKPDELKDYLTKFSKEHLSEKLNFNRILRFIMNDDFERSLKVYKTFPNRINKEEIFKYEILLKYFESFTFIQNKSELIVPFLLNELNFQENILIKLTIYNTLLELNVKIDEEDYQKIKKEFEVYLKENKFLKDHITSSLITNVIMKTRIATIKKERGIK